MNTVVNDYPELKDQSAEELLANLDSLPEDIQTTVRNQGKRILK